MALPKITYGIDLWYTPPAKPVGCTRNTGSVSALCSLQKAQRIASLAITGMLRTTPDNFIDVHAGIFPMELALLKTCHHALIWILTLPEYHLLRQIINKAKWDPLTKHLSPIDLLPKHFNIKDTKMETIYPAAVIKCTKDKFTTSIDSNRNDSITSESNDNADYKLFSDGSGRENKW